MADLSTYKRLELPKSNEKYNVAVSNKNNMLIDSELHKLDIKNQSQDDALAAKADLESPMLAGIPKAPTAPEGTNTAQIATTAFSQTAVSSHNASVSAHSDIRALISGLAARLNTLADSDDTTLDQLSEVVAYIKNNKSLIDGITTSKVNVSDIIDDITSAEPGKPLSARQGTVLKGLVTDLAAIVEGKADMVSGKGLSANDYTDNDKSKLEGIAAGAQANVQSDWNTTDATSDSYIRNKPASLPASDVPAWAKADTKPTYDKSEIGLGNVENKSSAAIRGELTAENVIAALGYTPPAANITYNIATASANGLMSKEDKSKLDNTNVAYATCGTAGGTSAKTAAIVGNKNWALKAGAIVGIKFTNTNTASNCTLNVENTGAKQIWYNSGAYTGAAEYVLGSANKIIWYMFDGTYWVWASSSGMSGTSENNGGIYYSDPEPKSLSDGMTWIGIG